MYTPARIIKQEQEENLPDVLKKIDSKRILYYSSGREAIFSLLEQIEPQVVLLPFMVPEGLFFPFNKNEWKIIYYNLGENGDPDLPDVSNKCKKHNPQFIILIHLFGIDRDIKSFNQSITNGVQIIEDFSHTYFSRDIFNNSVLSPYKLFSLPKIIGCTDGAVVIYPEKSDAKEQKFHASGYLRSLFIAVRRFSLIAATVENKKINAVLSRIMYLFYAVGNMLSYQILMHYCLLPTRISNIGMKMFLRTNHEEVISTRLRQANLYKKNLDQSFLFPEYSIAKYSFPLMGYPIRLRNRAHFIKYLKKYGIRGIVFDYKWHFVDNNRRDEFSSGFKLLNQHFLLPVNQKFSDKEIHKIIGITNNYNKL